MRIRSIKPEFWISESNGRLSRDARLIFIGLWNMADDSGRLRASSPLLASSLLPYDEDAREVVERAKAELSAAGKVLFYEVDGDCFAEICNFNKHQKIDKRWVSQLPEARRPSPVLADSPRFSPVLPVVVEQVAGSGAGSGEIDSTREDAFEIQLSEEHAMVMDAWKTARSAVGLTYLPDLATKSGAGIFAGQIRKKEITLDQIKIAMKNLMSHTEERTKYTLSGLARNPSLWIDGGPKSDKPSFGGSRKDRPITGPAAREAGKFDQLENGS